eukprot:COSAG01_NODE_18825_length_1050_cov_2.896951_2_plen_143_part_01
MHAGQGRARCRLIRDRHTLVSLFSPERDTDNLRADLGRTLQLPDNAGNHVYMHTASEANDEHRHHTRRNPCNLPTILRAVRYPRWYVSVCACVTRADCACGHGRLAGCVGGPCVRVCAPQIMPVESYVAMELAALRLNMTSGL